MIKINQVANLLRSPKTKISGDKAAELNCPSCQQPEAYAMEHPDGNITIGCNRKNNCNLGQGGEKPAKAFFPHLFAATPSGSRWTAPVIQLLKEKNLTGSFYDNMQATFSKYTSNGSEVRIPACRFLLDNHTKEKPSYNSRHPLIYDDKKGKEVKAKNFGDTSKGVWLPRAITEFNEVVIVEAPYKGIALLEYGLNNIVSLTSSGQKNPDNLKWIQEHKEQIKNKKTSFVLAMDNDNAGLSCIEGWIKWLDANHLDFGIALCPDGKDWNDFQITKESLNECLSRGDNYLKDRDKKESEESAKVIQIVEPIKEETSLEYFTELPPCNIAKELATIMKANYKDWPIHVCIYASTSLLAHIFQGYIKTESNGCISAYNIILGVTGSGKSNVIDLLKALCYEINPLLEPLKAPSNTSFIQRFNEQPNQSIVKFEGEYLLDLYKLYKTKHRDSSYSTILDLHGSHEHKKFMGQKQATGKNSKDDDKFNYDTIIGPTFGFIGGGTPEDWAIIANDKTFLTGGLGTRIEICDWGKVCEETPYSQSNFTPRTEPFRHIIQRLKLLCESLDKLYSCNNRKIVTNSPEALSVLDPYSLKVKRKINKTKPGTVPPSRNTELVNRICSRIAAADMELVGNSLTNPIVSPELMNWAIKFVENSFSHFKETSTVDLSPDKLWVDRARDYLKKRGSQGASRSQLGNFCKPAPAVERRNLLIQERIEDGEWIILNKRIIDSRYNKPNSVTLKI